MSKIQKEGYIYTFENRIRKDKLPKGLSYVLQTTDITNVLSTDGLALSYTYRPDNPQKVEKSVGRKANPMKRVRDFSSTKVDLLSYTKWGRKWGKPGTRFDYDRFLLVYSVPAKLRKAFRFILTTDILPRLKDLESYPTFNVFVYYRAFHKDNYEPLDWGGLYIEEDRYGDKAKVRYRDKEFDLDKEIKECVL